MSQPESDTRRATASDASEAKSRCADCAAELAPALLACPACDALVHRDALNALAASAEAAAARQEYSQSLADWRRALTLLPPQSRQHRRITEIIQGLSQRVSSGANLGEPSRALAAPGDSAPSAATADGRAGKTAGKSFWALVASGASIALLKFKSLIGLLLASAKPLALGLTKLGTLGSMLLSLGFYWAAFGWQLAAGFIACIYVHEIGHVIALQKLGIAASAPMFVPGLGAFVRSKQYPIDAREDAHVGLAGPRWGLAASAVSLAFGFALHSAAFYAIAELSAWVNLFNLLPVWSLDGARGLRPLNTRERRGLALALGAAWLLTHNPFLALIAAVTLWRSFERNDEPGDTRCLLEFLLIALLLTSVMVVATALSPAALRPGAH